MRNIKAFSIPKEAYNYLLPAIRHKLGQRISKSKHEYFYYGTDRDYKECYLPRIEYLYY